MAKKQEGKYMSDEKQPQYGEWEDIDNQKNDTPQVIPSPSMEDKVPLLRKFHELTPAELGLGAAGIAAVTMAGGQIIKNAVSRIFPSESERQYREQNNIQKEKLNRGFGQKTESDIEHQQRLRENEYAIAQEKLNRERIKTQQLQAKEGIASTEKPSGVPANVAGSTVELPNTATTGIQTTPTATAESTLGMLPPVTHNAQGVPAPFAVPAQINPSSNPTGAIRVGNMPEGGSPAPFSTQPVIPSPPANPSAPLATPPATPAQQVIEQTTGTAPEPPVSNQSAIGEVSVNPVESGSEANPLHEQGSEVGKTQIKATSDSTNPNVEGKQRGGVSEKPRDNPTKAKREVGYSEENKISRELHGEPIMTTSNKTHEELAEIAKTPQMKKFYIQQYEGNDKLKKAVAKAYKTGRLNEGDIFIPNATGGTTHFLNMNYNKGEDDVLKDYKAFRDTYYQGRPDIPYDDEYLKNVKEFNAKRNPASSIPGLEKMSGEQVGKANPEETNFFKSKHLRTATIGSTAGLILTASQMAQAAQEAQKGNLAPTANLAGQAGATALLSKLFGLGAKGAGAGVGLGTYAPELIADEEKQLAQHRYAYEMSKKNGAGRGQLNSTK
jgi:hypothetical protein